MPDQGNEPPIDSSHHLLELFESFWIECAERHDPHPVAMLSCRRCGVHHVLWRDADDNPPTLAAVIAIADQHGWCSNE